MKKKILFLSLATLFLAGVGFYFYTQKPTDDTIRLYGNVDIRQVNIGFQVNGLISKMMFDEGEHVNKGALLAELDNKDYFENNQKTRAEINRLTALRDEAQSVLDTYTPLEKEGYTSKREYTSYQNKLKETQSALESAIITQHIAQNQLEYTKVYAPDDGIITVRVQEPGAMVQAGQIIYTIAKDKPIWIRAYIAEKHLGNVVYGTQARITTDSIDPKTNQKRTYTGRIGYISPVAEFTPKSVETQDLRTDLVYRIHIYIDDADAFLKQGMPVSIDIIPE